MRAMGKIQIDKMLDRRGHRLPETVRIVATRGHLLRLGAKSFFRGMSERQQAEQLRKVIDRYAAGRWRRHKLELTCPDTIRGTVYEIAFCILRQQDRVPGFTTIKNALRGIR